MQINLSPLQSRAITARAMRLGCTIDDILRPWLIDQAHDEVNRSELTEESVQAAEARAVAAAEARAAAKIAAEEASLGALPPSVE